MHCHPKRPLVDLGSPHRHARAVLRDKLVSRTISLTDLFSRKHIRLTLPIMVMVITPFPPAQKGGRVG